MHRRAFLSASAGGALALTSRAARADAIDVEKVPKAAMRSLFTIPWGSGRGQIGHTPARESAPLGPGGLYVTPDHEIHVLDVVNDRILSFGQKNALYQTVPLPVKAGEAREWIDFAALEKNHFLLVERVSTKLIVVTGGGTVGPITSFANVPSMKHPGLVSALVMDRGARPWLEAEGRHHRVEPAKDGNDIVVLPGTPTQDGKSSLIARLDRPRNVKIVRGDGANTLFADLRFPRDVGHIETFDLTPLGGAWIVVQTQEERKVAPFDILKTELTVLQLDPEGKPTARFTLPVSTDEGEVRHPSRLGRNGRFYALVRNKRGTSVFVTP